MSNHGIEITRRQLLRAAGGVTFPALTSTESGPYTATFDRKQTPARIVPALPLFTALPCIQPGTASSKLVEGQEALLVAWQTNGTLADYLVEYGPAQSLERKGAVTRQERLSAERADRPSHWSAVAALRALLYRDRQPRHQRQG